MLLRRYHAGEFEKVWQEIRLLGDLNAERREEVMAVAEATMQRVAHNADIIAGRLRAAGWRALLGQYHDLRTAPARSDDLFFSRIEELTGGPIPPTLLAFWRVVGGVNWVWDYDSEERPPNLGFDLPLEEYDALCVDAPWVITYLFDEWIDHKNVGYDDLKIDLAPDFWHKANISGGSAYCVKVPFFGADPLFADERHELPFLDYLRLAFRWGGFPGLDRHAARRDVQEFVKRFTKDVLPF